MEDYKENLKTYIKEDIIYQEYLKNKNKNFSDFDKFCIQHCKDIEELLEENEKLKAELQLYQGALSREHEAIHRVNDLEEENQKYKEVIDKATNELFILKDMIYKPETREENFEIQRKISSIIKRLNGKEVE